MKECLDKGYSLCWNKWALDFSIKGELGLLLIISSLTAKEGYCFASNGYFAEMFGISETSISKKIKKLEDKGYISIKYKKRGCEVVSREIRINHSLPVDSTKVKSSNEDKLNRTNEEKLKDNITRDNNTSINSIGDKHQAPKKQVKKPLLEREPENDIERVEKVYLQNYQSLYKSGIVKTEKPVINWLQSRKLTKQVIETYGVDTIINAVKDSINNDFCVSKGYCLTMILSAGVLSGLINVNNRSSGSVVKRTGVDTVTQEDLDNLAF